MCEKYVPNLMGNYVSQSVDTNGFGNSTVVCADMGPMAITGNRPEIFLVTEDCMRRGNILAEIHLNHELLNLYIQRPGRIDSDGFPLWQQSWQKPVRRG